jgi:hypothetical protein
MAFARNNFYDPVSGYGEIGTTRTIFGTGDDRDRF